MGSVLRKLILPVLAVLCVVLALNPAGPVNGPAERAARDAATASLGVYVALRSINAALSFAQEIEVGGSVGLSANAQPLKFLEPIDDTVERVAALVFGVTLFAGTLSIGIGPVASIGFLVLAVGLGVQWLRGPLERRAGSMAAPVCRAGSACSFTGVMLALALPLSLALGNLLGEVVTDAKWQEANAELEQVASFAQSLLGAHDVVAASEEAAGGNAAGGWIGWLQDSLGAAGAGLSGAVAQTDGYLEAAGYFMSNADTLLESSLTLVAIFLLRTLILPLAFLAVAVALLRQSWRST
ncbi:hypothetical protein [Aliiruegeria sabulilitoris]|uniref:hypothetical protein n=1 Tax=Aliiruegeria sabulilitoris TaxID=1510458 RepID=UPI000830401B|nr:hypothetical protein [Aliiruegeria sabulilitoris]NDR59338.1 hypothetical protein [Pseudoruegeria sp. M32A2M]